MDVACMIGHRWVWPARWVIGGCGLHDANPQMLFIPTSHTHTHRSPHAYKCCQRTCRGSSSQVGYKQEKAVRNTPDQKGPEGVYGRCAP